MGKIYLTRHGKTLLNSLNRFQGILDTEETFLNEEGIKQAKALALRLKDVHLDKIYSSPLKRAIQTSQYINEYHDIEIIIEEELIERSLGSWEGKEQKEALLESKLTREKWIENSELFIPKDAESLDNLKNRITNIFLKIANENKDKDILIVAHVSVIQVITSIIKYEDLNLKVFVPQTSLTIIENNNDGFKVLLDADISHLEK